MPSLESAFAVHPVGENNLSQSRGRWTRLGGRYWAEFDDQAPVTREGQLIFFAQFLQVGGRWERFVKKSPLR